MNKQEHLLTILVEECSEIQKEVCKGLRFGLDDHGPNNPEFPNEKKIVTEIIDLMETVSVLKEEGILHFPEPELEKSYRLHKRERIRRYMEYAAITRKTLT